jgi:hypothetical protein
MGPLPRVTQGRGRAFPCVRGSQGSIPSYQVPLGVRPISWLGDLVDVGNLASDRMRPPGMGRFIRVAIPSRLGYKAKAKREHRLHLSDAVLSEGRWRMTRKQA